MKTSVMLILFFTAMASQVNSARPLTTALCRSELRSMKKEIIMQSCEYLVSSVERRNPRA